MPLSRNREEKQKPKQKITASVAQQQKPTQQTQNSIQRTQKLEFYQGLIPHPEMMEQYKQIDPSLPMRIVGWTEEEGIHRRNMEAKIVKHSYNTVVWGYVLGFLCVALISVLCYLFMINGNPREGMWIACIIIVALAVVFVLRKVPKVGKPGS